jgi:hypothetical protein
MHEGGPAARPVGVTVPDPDDEFGLRVLTLIFSPGDD